MKPPFTPPKLPPRLDLSPIIREIGAAHDAVSELNGVLTQVPNPDLLTAPLVTKEAVLSSKIEGTQATLEEVFEHDAGEPETGASGEDVQEVVNYRAALRQGLELLKDQPLSENLVKALHSTLLRSGRGHSRMPGEFRRSLVYVGAPNEPEHARYVPPLPVAIPELMSDLGRYLNATGEPDGLVQIGIAHYQFEAVHPFMDGNGRIGRLLIPLLLYRQGRLSHPLIYISEFFEAHREQYYALLNGVSERDEWLPWIKFFLEGLTTQAQKTKATARSILALYDDLKRRVVAAHSVYGAAFLDALFVRPVVTAGQIRARVPARSEQTVYNLVRKFVELRILRASRLKLRRGARMYVFDDLMSLLR